MDQPNRATRRLNLRDPDRVTVETLRHWLLIFASNVRAGQGRLTELDSAIGDGDHGVNMRRGVDAVQGKLNEIQSIDLSGQLRIISVTLTSSVGGASGPLYGAFFLHASHAAQHKPDLGLLELCSAVESGCGGVVRLGKAEVGDKTMVDTLSAIVRSLKNSCGHRETLSQAVISCRDAGHQAMEGTAPMAARKGRASYLGARSVGTQDPGSASAFLLFEALARAVALLSSTRHSTQKNDSL